MFENLKRKTHKIHKIKAHLDISIMYSLGISFLTNENKIISKGLFENKGPILILQKFINYHLVIKVSPKKNHI
jgi:hypothetical protein